MILMISMAKCCKSWLAGGTPKGVVDIAEWMLVPSTLPPMELRVQRFASVRRSEGVVIPVVFHHLKQR
jgi:hypothetical protein